MGNSKLFDIWNMKYNVNEKERIRVIFELFRDIKILGNS